MEICFFMSSLNYSDKIKVGNSSIGLWQIKAGLGGEGNSGDFTYVRDIKSRPNFSY